MQQLGRYRILGELGRGAMGVVYRASDEVLNRTVAIKTINMAADPQERAEYERRFYQEAKAAGSLNHPNIVTIYDLGQVGDVVYMAMEYIEGTELRDLLQGGRLDLATAVDIVAQVAEGLAFAHERGVVHRDVKPANIMVVRGGPAKIMDFGIARIRTSEVKTQTGMLLGSPKYMAPEQLLGGEVDQRCDLFSLGVVLYEAVTGVTPFSGTDITQIMYQIVHAAPPVPSAINRRATPMLDLIVAKALAKEPAERYQHARELATDLRACRAQLATPADSGDDDTEATMAMAPAGPASDDSPTQRMPAAAADPPAVATTRAARSGDGGPRLRLSRRFDSTEAMRRLAHISGGEDLLRTSVRTLKLDLKALHGAIPERPAARERTPMQSRRPRERLVVIASVIIAVLVAAAIALG
jgi:serine/threonine-protein kinase